MDIFICNVLNASGFVNFKWESARAEEISHFLVVFFFVCGSLNIGKRTKVA